MTDSKDPRVVRNLTVPKFSPGDPVWVRDTGSHNTYIKAMLKEKGETAAVVTGVYMRNRRCRVCHSYVSYRVDVFPPDVSTSECCLRPRRDDYQQHEGLGSIDKVHQVIASYDVAVWKPKVDA